MDEQSAVGSILNEYQNRVYRLALSICRNEKDAEDILQNTLIKIFRNIAQFNSRSRLSTWIYRVAYNESLMFLRKKRRLFNSANAFRNYAEHLPSGFAVTWSRLPDKEVLDKELRERIDAALKELPIQYRMPLLLHRIEGLSLLECSRVLSVKPSTVKTRLHRAYLMVKDRMNGYFKDRPEPKREMDQRCGRWTGFLSEYAQNKLNPRTRTSFHRHIKSCPGCNRFLNGYAQAIRITGALDCRDVPAELTERLEAFFSLPKKK